MTEVKYSSFWFNSNRTKSCMERDPTKEEGTVVSVHTVKVTKGIRRFSDVSQRGAEVQLH